MMKNKVFVPETQLNKDIFKVLVNAPESFVTEEGCEVYEAFVWWMFGFRDGETEEIKSRKKHYLSGCIGKFLHTYRFAYNSDFPFVCMCTNVFIDETTRPKEKEKKG